MISREDGKERADVNKDDKNRASVCFDHTETTSMRLLSDLFKYTVDVGKLGTSCLEAFGQSSESFDEVCFNKEVPTRLAFPLWLYWSKLPVDNSFRFIHCYLDPEATQETLKALVGSPVHDRAHQRVMQKLQNKRRCLAFFVCCQPARTPAVLCNTPFLTLSSVGLAEIHA
jgi:hypothetical protein